MNERAPSRRPLARVALVLAAIPLVLVAATRDPNWRLPPVALALLGVVYALFAEIDRMIQTRG